MWRAKSKITLRKANKRGRIIESANWKWRNLKDDRITETC